MIKINIQDNIILKTSAKPIAIGLADVYFTKDFIYNEKKHIRYIGKINILNMPISLDILLNKKIEYIAQGIFSQIDAIDDEINQFELILENFKERIYDIYIEDQDIEFSIIHGIE